MTASLISTKQKNNVAHVDLPKLEFQEVTLDILPPHFFAWLQLSDWKEANLFCEDFNNILIMIRLKSND